MPTAEEVLSKTFIRFLNNWSVITSLRQVADMGLPLAENILTQQYAAYVDEMDRMQQLGKIFINIDGSHKQPTEELKTFVREGMTNTAVTNARMAIDAATVVFAQSILDDCALSYCVACSLAAPNDWEQFFNKRNVDYASMRSKSADQIRDELIEKKLAELERGSLIEKIDLLFQLCQPPKGFEPIGNYAYDRDRVVCIDADRQAIIHRNGLRAAREATIEADLEFLSKTANFLLSLVHQRYGVQLNPVVMFDLQIPPHP